MIHLQCIARAQNCLTSMFGKGGGGGGKFPKGWPNFLGNMAPGGAYFLGNLSRGTIFWGGGQISWDTGATCSEQLAHEHCNIDDNVAILGGNRTPDLTVKQWRIKSARKFGHATQIFLCL